MYCIRIAERSICVTNGISGKGLHQAKFINGLIFSYSTQIDEVDEKACIQLGLQATNFKEKIITNLLLFHWYAYQTRPFQPYKNPINPNHHQ